jgi:glycosyltransferase involved in cell wall biosynthesis
MNFVPPLTLSVVIPIYNGKRFLISTIESVRNQTYPDWDLILCDNGSTDGSVAMLEEYLEKIADSRIRLVHQEHISFAQDWNRTIGHASGDLIKVLPSDDILLPSCLETQVKLLRENADVGFVSSGKHLIDASGKKYFERSPLKEGRYDWSTLGHRLVYAIVNLVGEPGGVLFRRELLLRYGLFDDNFKYFIDVDMYIRLLQQTNLYITERPLYQFRVHGSSVSASSRKMSVLEYARLLDRHEKVLGLARKPLHKFCLKQKAYLIALSRSVVIQTCVLINAIFESVSCSGSRSKTSD